MIGSTALRVRTSVVGRYGRASWELLGYDPEDSRFASFLGGLGQADIDPWFPAVIGPGVGTALKRLASVTKMVVVSDSAGTIEDELAVAGICQVGPGGGASMVAVIDSGAVGVDRPDPAIFNLALDAVHATPDEAIHIGDSAWTDADLVRARRRCIAALPASPAGSLCTEQNWLGLRRVHGEYDCRMLLSVAQFCEVYQQAIRNRMAPLS